MESSGRPVRPDEKEMALYGSEERLPMEYAPRKLVMPKDLCEKEEPIYVGIPILLLAELLMTPILFFLWLRLLSGSWERAVYVLLLCLSCAAAVGFISYCMVMPVSAFLIDGAFGGLAS